MDYLSQDGRIDLAVVDARDYSGFHGKFIEDLDPHLASLIMDDNTTFKIPVLEYVEEDGNWKTRQKKDESGELLWMMIGWARSMQSRSLIDQTFVGIVCT